MSRARVLILVENEPVPSDRHVWNHCRALTRAGLEVVVICPRGTSRDRGPYELREGVEIHRFDARPSDGGMLGFVGEYLHALLKISGLVRKLSRGRGFDVVHACTPPDFLLLAALPLRARGTRFVFDHHDLTPELYLSRFSGRGTVHRATLLAERLGLRLADVVLSVNDSYRKVAIGRGRCHPDDVFVVRTAPDLDRFRPVAPDPVLKAGRKHLLAYVGVMGPQDGVDYALRALARLHERRRDWHAVLMGDGDELEPMRRLTTELGLDEHVEFTGWAEHDAIRRALSTCDVSLAPDPRNALNDVSSMIKLYEYMAMSRPIVSFGLPESRVSAGDAAVYAADDDVDDFARLIDELLDDPERRAAMGEAGRRRIEEALAWEFQERNLLAAYQRLLTGAAATAPSVAIRTSPEESRAGVSS